MSANRRRGEIEAELDGLPRRLCLTLGALAELESAFGVDDLNALAARFGQGRFSARDLARLIGAGLRGAGADVRDEQVLAMSADGGVAGFATIVGELLEATFGVGEPNADGGAGRGAGDAAGQAGEATRGASEAGTAPNPL